MHKPYCEKNDGTTTETESLAGGQLSHHHIMAWNVCSQEFYESRNTAERKAVSVCSPDY